MRARLEILCPFCRASNPPPNKFCHECGTLLAAASSAAASASPQSHTPRHRAEKILTSRSALEGEETAPLIQRVYELSAQH